MFVSLSHESIHCVPFEGFVSIDLSSQPLKEHIQTYVQLTSNTKTEDGFAIFGPEDAIPLKFNISFMTNARPFCLMESAVSTVADLLNSEDTKQINLARQWTFPEPKDFFTAPSQKLENAGVKKSQWVDSGLNAEQRVCDFFVNCINRLVKDDFIISWLLGP